jgi:hypothetical protein
MAVWRGIVGLTLRCATAPRRWTRPSGHLPMTGWLRLWLHMQFMNLKLSHPQQSQQHEHAAHHVITRGKILPARQQPSCCCCQAYYAVNQVYGGQLLCLGPGAETVFSCESCSAIQPTAPLQQGGSCTFKDLAVVSEAILYFSLTQPDSVRLHHPARQGALYKSCHRLHTWQHLTSCRNSGPGRVRDDSSAAYDLFDTPRGLLVSAAVQQNADLGRQ